MKLSKINGERFYYMILSGSNSLEEQKDYVNALNVFPVPDGDTGTNMSLTFRAAATDILGMKDSTVGEISKVLSKGALMGARGNSGVILSQIFRGISKALENKSEATSKDMAEALLAGSKFAYKAVMRPTEGTMLTIIKEAGEIAVKSKNTDVIELLKEICSASKEMLDKTPEMLPALKKAKVVDAGGMGVLLILKGMLRALEENLQSELMGEVKTEVIKTTPMINLEEINFGYCTEFFISTNKVDVEEFRNKISKFGDSIIVVNGDGIIKIHIHTNDPGFVLSEAIKYGELSKIKIDNMREQHRSIIEAEVKVEKTEEKEYAFISVAMGEGIKELFKNELMVDHVIEGGQTMNPSTQDFLDCIKEINAKTIYILPNNKNIIMAANQASEISEKDVVVIPTKTIPQGVTALTVFNSEASRDDNITAMTEAKDNVASGSITYAVRDTEMDGIEISGGNILGLIEDKIQEVGEDPFDVCEKIIENMVKPSSELISIYLGSDINNEDANNLTRKIQDKFENLDVLVFNGKQPLYYFIVSVE